MNFLKRIKIMKKRLLYFIILLINLCVGKDLVAFGKSQTIDSLLTQLLKAKEDKNKVLLFTDLIYAHLDYKTEEGLKFEKPALELAEKLNWQGGIHSVKNVVGTLYWRLNKFDNALKYHFDALKIAETMKDKKLIVADLTSIGQDYADHADYPEAMNYFNKGLVIAQEAGQKTEMSTLHGLISWVYGKQGNYPEAAKSTLCAIRIAEESGDKYGVSIYMTNIADDYSMLGLDSMALLYLDSAIAPQIKENDMANVTLTYIKIGAIQQRFKNYNDAQKYYELALGVSKEINDKQGIVEVYRNMASSFVARGNDAEALKSYLLAAESLKSMEAYQLTAALYIDIGQCYTRLKEYASAKKYFDNAGAISKKIGSEDITKDYYGGMELLDSATGNWKDAYLNYKTSIRLRDKLYNDENTKKVMQSSMQYEFDKKEAVAKAEQEKKDAVAQQDVQNQKIVKNSLIAGFILVVLLVGVTYNRYRLKQKSHAQLSKTLHELKETQDQLVMSEKMAAFGLVASRVAHEIHNPLNFINNFSELSEELIHDFISAKDEHEKRELSKELITNLKKINQHGKRAENIVKQLQEHTRSGTAHEFFEENQT
jgi:two-component system NtrC family sensor kinase